MASTNRINLTEKVMQFYPILDVRGKRSEEAMSEVESFIDSAILSNAPEVKIIHGKGDGILRQLIRSQLRRHSHIAGLSDEHADRGGDGATIVKLN